MFLFEHCGITLAVALGVNAAITKSRSAPPRYPITGNPPIKIESSSQLDPKTTPITSLFGSLGKHLDIRFLLVGSILPDIIDKPVGMFLYGNGRSFAHTLLFTLGILLLGLYFNKVHRKNSFLALSTGTLSHLILDEMWLSRNTLLWPLYGWSFPGRIEPAWFGIWWTELFDNPLNYMGELACLGIILIYLGIIARQRKTIFFLKHGYF